ncbi:MAG TPA: molybdopterin-binding/glycosyltransferase family 2 protein [Rhizobiaceae bacterium]|nr:molybdopterin-binding/glycosyltransferase family 2 protein [Rhizobiaceae bacterium]
MKFGPVPAEEGEGAILAHALKLPSGRRIAKGSRLAATDIADIVAAGIGEIIVAQPGPEDIGEDYAAQRIASAMLGPGIRLAPASTGRVNVHATVNGLFTADRARVDAINACDPGITLATLPDLTEVEAGRMVATVKIIPYALPREAVDMATEIAGGAIGLDAYSPKRIGVVATTLPSLKPSVMDKTIRVLMDRLAPSGSTIMQEIRTGHDEVSVARAIGELLPLSDIVLVFGASAISDIDDVIPAAIRANGGRIEHFGMPVDPGNLMLLGEADGKPVIGAPGCARSPAENGFDWILQRLMAGRKVTAGEITGLGVGGLLMEIGTRPQPREKRPSEPVVSAVILAAGRSTRMGAHNKLLARLDGKALVRHVAEAAMASSAAETIVVTGHEAELVEAALASLPVRVVRNQDFAEGMATSLAAGIDAVSPDSGSAIVLLGDMPLVSAAMIDRMIEAHAAAPKAIVMASHNGERGNPVLWPKGDFPALKTIRGDKGARERIAEEGGRVIAVELGEAAGFDLDTPQALIDAGGMLPG